MPPKNTRTRNSGPGTSSASRPHRVSSKPSRPHPKSRSSEVSRNAPAASQDPRVTSRIPRAACPTIPLPNESDESLANTCSICAEPAQDWAVGRCPHVVCGDCSHRLRVLYSRNSCVMCNANLKQVVVVPLRDYRQEMTFDDAVALPGAFQDKQVEMWFVNRGRSQQLKNVRGWMCSHKACRGKNVFANATQLRAHARTEHRSLYCEVCWGGKKTFVSEMSLYTMDADRNFSSRLRGHLRKEHPKCRFCGHYYLDDEKLYAHLQESHETCAICERNGRMHEYYVNYEQLENHYRHEHYVCPDPGCRGVVFATQIELQTHEHTHHNDNPRNARARSLRVNLQQLHGDRDTQRRDTNSARDVEVERERQAARRRAFLSSSVVFSGALNDDDEANTSAQNEGNNGGSSSQPFSSSQARSPVAGGVPLPAQGGTAMQTRRPDDGHFYPLELPRDGDELKARNTMLIRSMRSTLDPAAYEQFRMSSGQFHSGEIDANEYYEAVVDAFGVRTAIRDILPELVALLPTPLLREPLLRACMQRTDTKPNRIGYMGPPTSAAGSSAATSAGSRVQDEQFPTLNGVAAPVRPPPASMRRFGAPGPDEFPRLGRVNKPQGAPSASQPSKPVGSSAGSSRTKPPAAAKASAAKQQKTAASVLRELPRSMHMASQRPTGAVRGSNVATGAQLQASAFPSLASATSPSPASPFTNTDGSGNSTAPDVNPSSDVSMRAGAVWGGVAARAHNRGGKKRGPGRGQGQQPASPPKRTMLGSNDFPDLRSRSQSGMEPSTATSTEQSLPGPDRQSAVIDVMAVSKARKNNLQKSSLPKVGGSGYGFAWDRKKVQQKKKQIKSAVGQTGSSIAPLDQSNGINAMRREPAPENNERQKSNLTTETYERGASSGEAEDLNNLAHHLEDVDVNGTSAIPDSAPIESEDFDPYSYLKRDAATTGAAASFFGNSG